jgi:hypothetical protein
MSFSVATLSSIPVRMSKPNTMLLVTNSDGKIVAAAHTSKGTDDISHSRELSGRGTNNRACGSPPVASSVIEEIVEDI